MNKLKNFIYKYKNIIISILVCFILEIFVFNFESLKSYPQTSFDIAYGQGLYYEDGKYTYIPNLNHDITLYNFNGDIKNVYFELTDFSDETMYGYTIAISLSDEGNSQNYEVGYLHIYADNIYSKYFVPHYNGKLNTITISLESDDLSYLEYKSFNFVCKVNQNVPIRICLTRMIFIFLLFYTLQTLFTSIKISDLSSKKIIFVRIIVPIILGIISIFATYLWGSKYFEVNEDISVYNSYNLLAKSLSQGHLYLDAWPSKELINLSNPYDYSLRKIENVNFIWDCALFNNHYYVYFGVVPAVLFYLPYYLLTKSYLCNVVPCIISLCLYCFGLINLLYTLCKQYFPNIRTSLFLFISISTFYLTGVSYCYSNLVIYTIPIILSLAFLVNGIWLCLAAFNQNYNDKKRCLLLILGCLMLALIAGCRPQMCLIYFAIIPLLINKLKGVYKNKYKQILLSIAIPFVLVAIMLCAYNYFRFGSIFDFGSNYNLTTNDMTHRGFKLARLPYGIFAYLFQPIKFTTTFPFIQQQLNETKYRGICIYENMYGGLFFYNISLLLPLIMLPLKKYFNKSIYYTMTLLFIFGVIIVCVDIQMAGILPRYFMDFSIFFYIATILAIFTIANSFDSANTNWQDIIKVFLYIVIVVFIIAIVLELFKTFEYHYSSLMNDNNSLYNKIKYILQFWY